MKKVLRRFIAIGTSTILTISMVAVTASAQSWEDVGVKMPVDNSEIENSANLISDASESDIEFGLQKSEMAGKVMTVREKASADPKSITADDIAIIQTYIDTYAPDCNVKMYMPDNYNESGFVPMLEGDGDSANLELPGEVQTTDYYCAPATAYAILMGRGISTTQEEIAEKAKTTTSGTNMSKLLSAMNSYSGTNGNKFKYAILSGPGSYTTDWYNTMTADAITTLEGGYGVVYNVHMVKATGSARLSGYETMYASNIYHYVAGEGYNCKDATNRICYYYDSNNKKSFTDRHKNVTFETMARLTDDMNIGW